MTVEASFSDDMMRVREAGIIVGDIAHQLPGSRIVEAVGALAAIQFGEATILFIDTPDVMVPGDEV